MIDHPDVGHICAKWRRSALYPDRETGSSRKARAELRRADTTLAVLCVDAVHDLCELLMSDRYSLRQGDGPDRLALIAVAMAHVRSPQPVSAARCFGAGDPPPLSGIRFNALLKTENPRALLHPLRRALAVVGGSVDDRTLAHDLYWWTDRIRAKWCFDYHGAHEAKPEDHKKTEDTTT